MDEKVTIARCKCGKKGFLYKNKEALFNHSDMYYIACECGNKTHELEHIEDALEEWKEMNKPLKVKPQYHCGYCGAELVIGFDVCTKCGAEIDW